MMRNPRVLAGLVRYRIRGALGLHRIPHDFDSQAEPPATDYLPDSTAQAATRTGAGA